LSESISRVLPENNDSLEELQETAAGFPSELKSSVQAEIVPSAETTDKGKADKAESYTKMDLHFVLQTVKVLLYVVPPDQFTSDLSNYQLSEFCLSEAKVKLHMVSDATIDSEIQMRTFTVKDTRRGKSNKFRDIIPAVNHDGYQFMANITMTGTVDRSVVAMLMIDSPRVIMAVDYLFAMQEFVVYPFSNKAIQTPVQADEIDTNDVLPTEDHSQLTSLAGHETPLESTNTQNRSSDNQKADPSASKQNLDIRFRIDIVDPSVIILANAASSSSEAILLSSKQIVMSQQQAFTLSVENVGMSLVRMDMFEKSRLRILDDFSVAISMELAGGAGKADFTTVEIDIEPMVLKLSTRDIVLMLSILNQASRMLEKEDSGIDPVKKSAVAKQATTRMSSKDQSDMKKNTKEPATVRNARDRQITEKQTVPASAATLKREILRAGFEGLRLILLGEEPDLPIVDMSLEKFSVDVRDWSLEVRLTSASIIS